MTVLTPKQVLDLTGDYDDFYGYMHQHAMLLHFAVTPRVPLGDAIRIGACFRERPLTLAEAEQVVATWNDEP